jgi:tetratricopeptide (TPR) repeat protein
LKQLLARTLAAGLIAVAGATCLAGAAPAAAPADDDATGASRPAFRLVQFYGQESQGRQVQPRGAQQQQSPGPRMPSGRQRTATGQAAGLGGPTVLRAFAITKTATNENDYSEIIELCHQGLEAGLDGSMTVYARRLMGWAHNRRGEARAEADEQDAALEDFEAAVALDDSKWRYVHNRGVSHATLGHYPKAIADFNQTLKMNPNYGNAYFNRGELRYEESDFVGAVADYTQAIKLDPRDATAFNSRGHAHYRLHEFREALADYHQAVRLDPTNAAAYTNRGDMYADFGRWANATSDYRTAMKLNPALGRAYQSAAWLLATCPEDAFRSANGAMLAARKAIELDGEGDYRYLETLAAAEANAGYFGDAVDTQAGALAVAPDDYRQTAEKRLQLYRHKTAYREAPRNLTQATANRPSRRPTQAVGR